MIKCPDYDIRILPMNLSAVKTICSWKYPEPYDVYNYMSFDEAVKNNSPLLKDENKDNYLCFWKDETLSAYININKKDDKAFIGIGLAPNLCGKGLGKMYLKQGIDKANFLYPDREIWVQVRSWNIRAIKCYESCGFKEKYKETVQDRLLNEVEFVFMCLEGLK